MRYLLVVLPFLLTPSVRADAPTVSGFQVLGCQGASTTVGAGATIHTVRPSFGATVSAGSPGLVGSCVNYAQPASNSAGLQALWKFDGNGLDSTQSFNHLNYVKTSGGASCGNPAEYGGPAHTGLGSSWQPSFFCSGDATNHTTHATPTTVIPFYALSAFTIETWLLWTGLPCQENGSCVATGIWPVLVDSNCLSTGGNRCLAVGLSGINMSVPVFYMGVGGGDSDALGLSNGYALSDGNYHHVAYVADATTMKIYIDGVLRGTRNRVNSAYQNVGTPVRVGGVPSSDIGFANRYATGHLDSLRVHGRALGVEELQAHARNQIFQINGNATLENNFTNGYLSGSYCTTPPGNGATTWNWSFGTDRTFPTGSVPVKFTAMNMAEEVGSATFNVNVVQTDALMTTPPDPTVIDVGMTSATWRVPTWFCDSANTYYSFATSAGTTVQYSRDHTSTSLGPNAAYGLNVKATYTDAAPGNGAIIGPSARTLTVYATTYANAPDAPTNLVVLGPTAAAITLDHSAGTPLNPNDTDINVEGSTDTGVSFNQVSDYAAWNENVFFPGIRFVTTNLLKSKKYYFRSRNRNRNGVVTAPSAAGADPAVTMVTQPRTPTSMRGSPAVGGGYCPKTDIRWEWDSVPMGSGSAEQYGLWREDGTTSIPGTTLSTNTYVEQGLSPSTTRRAVAKAFDTGAPTSPDIRYSDYSSTATAATAPVDIAAPTGLAGTPAALPFFFTTLPGITWDWNVPDTLCPGWTYTIINAQSGATIATLAANSLPTYDQYIVVPNTPASIQVRGNDAFATGTLSASATAYSPASAPSALSATQVSTGSLRLNWSAGGNPGYTRYEVSLSTDNFVTLNSSPVVMANDLTSTFAGISGLSAGTTYYLRARAFNGRSSDPYGGVPSALSPVLALMTLTQAPSLTAAVLSQTALDWNWSAVAGASGYRLYSDGGALLLDTPSGLSYSSTSLAVNGVFGAYIEAYNGQGLGNPSATGYAFTLANAPAALSVLSVSSNVAVYTWSGNGNPGYTFYEVNVATDSLFRAVVATRNVTGTLLIVDSLFPGTTYHARLRALNGGQSPTAYSLFASAVTDGDAQVSLSSPPASIYTQAAGLIGLWHLDEGSGLSAADASVTGNAGALACLTNGCSSTPTFAGGPPDLGSAVAFPGTSGSLVSAPHHAAYQFTGSMSVSAWVKPATTALADGAGIVAKGDGGSESFALDVVTSGGQKRYRFISRPGAVAVATSTIRAGEWDHVAGVFDDAADETRLYVNGALSATTASPLPRVSPAHPVSIGARQSGSGAYDLAFAGSIDEVRFANVALSAAQVQAEFRGSYPATFALPPPNDDVYLTFPPNAFGGSVVIYASNDPLNHPLRIGAATLLSGLLNAPTGQALAPGSLIEIVPTVAGAAFTGSLGSPATVSLPYPDSNDDGLVDGVSPQIAVGGLRVYTLNTSIGLWEALPTTLDRANRRASAPTPHFSIFALFGPSTVGTALGQVRVYPVPWKPGSSGRFDAAALTFDLLPAEGSVRIFTLAGDQVAEVPFSGADAGRVTWNGRNAAGRSAASGVYFAYVRDARSGASTVLKFAVER